MKIFRIVSLSILLVLLIGFAINYPKLKLISGFAAKNMASSYFLANRSVAKTNAEDNSSFLVSLATTTVQDESKTATANVFGLSEKKAVHRPGVGTVLISTENSPSTYKQPNRIKTSINLPYPYGNLPAEKATFKNINYTLLDSITDNCFVENFEDGIKNTRSILVLYKGKIIAEKYGNGFHQQSLLQGWSITKSLLATCFGVLQKENKYNIHTPITSFENWQQDARKNITTNDLLRMESGLEWTENYGKICDVTKMLFEDSDVTQRPISKKQIHPTATVFNYSSGTSNILSALLKKQFATEQEYLDYPYKTFIDKIGMHSMLLETDMHNNYVASSYSWATTRDWAKFGQLMLNRGAWNKETILNPSWIDYISTPNKSSKGEYGGHWWLNKGNYMPNVPKDCFYADGYQGQRIFVIPSKDLVIVRFGITQLDRVGFYPLFNNLVGTICKAVH